MTIWFTARGAGLALLCMLSLAAALGMVASLQMVTASTRVVLQYAHRTAALLSVVLLFLHVTTILLDSYANVGLLGALVPMQSGYRAFAVTLGTLSAYALVLTTVLGLARGRMANSPKAARSWRVIHIASSSMWVMAVIHSLLAGTDTTGGWAQLLVWGCVAIVVLALGLRLAKLDQPRSAGRIIRSTGHQPATADQASTVMGAKR